MPSSASGSPRSGPINPSKFCPVSNANWCSHPVPRFSNELGSYRNSGDCWTQADACYREAPATGNKGCKEWAMICVG